jgi:hypothetical protein
MGCLLCATIVSMTDISSFSVTVALGATFKTGESAWTKPAVETTITFDDIPDKDVLDTALAFMEKQILEPVLSDVAQAAVMYTRKAHGLETQETQE